jgi:hypothetical protein
MYFSLRTEVDKPVIEHSVHALLHQDFPDPWQELFFGLWFHP